jgi:L-lactate dehydrogenase complex protein LldE
MRILLHIPCLVEDCMPEIGLAAHDVLARLGHSVTAPSGQTCCGQLAYKTGDLDAARALARRALDLFPGPDPVVSPSGSCAKMLRSYPALFEPGTPEHARAVDLAGRTYEFCGFIASQPGFAELAPRLDVRACLHRSCQLDGSDAPERVLGQIAGLTLLDPERPERCCGFGGLFSLQFSAVSEALLEEKAREILASGADMLVSAEPSCLMNIGGYLSRKGEKLPVLHAAQVIDRALGGKS